MSLLSNTSTPAVFRTGRRASQLNADDFAQLRFVGALGYASIAVILALLVALPHHEHSGNLADALLAGLGLVLAGAHLLLPRNIWTARISPLVGMFFVGAIVAVARPLGATALLFLLPMLSTAYFLGRRELAAGLGLFAVIAAVSLTANTDTSLLLGMPTLLVVALLSLVTLVVRERDDSLVAQLEQCATTDRLTGLVNRRTFSESVERELERARRSELPLSVAVFDLAHFKSINARLGQAAGDHAIKRFSEVLHAESRTVDVAGSLDGEQFALLLTDCDADGAKQFADRFIRRLQLY